MKLVTYLHSSHGSQWRAGVLQGDCVLDAARLVGARPPLTMLELLEEWDGGYERLLVAANRFADEFSGSAQLPGEMAAPIWEARLTTPLPDPPSLRDFYAFEQHVGVGYRRRGRDIPEVWYREPVFYFGHAGNLLGPDEDVSKPAGTTELDYELELAAVIGIGGRDIPAAEAWRHIAGFTVMNDWSARDIQRDEMALGLGPAKGKDFATSLGPAIVTLDELADRIQGKRISLEMNARVNGEPISRDSSESMYWGFPDLIERASRNVWLRPGDVIGSGTCGTGCIFELGVEVQPWLEPGDEVELEIERIGRLRTAIA